MDLLESGTFQSANCWMYCNVQGKIGESEMEEIRDMVIKVEGMVFVPNLGWKHVEIYEIGNRRGGFGIGGGMCYEVSLVVFDWEDVFIVKF